MTSDIQSILQLLQRQTCLGPPAYSSLTDFKRPAIRVQPVASVPTCQSPSTTSQVQHRLLHTVWAIPEKHKTSGLDVVKLHRASLPHFYFLLLQNTDFLGMTNVRSRSKDSPSGLSLMDSSAQQSYGTLQPSQDSAPTYSLIDSQTLPLARQHSKSHLPIQQSSPPDTLLNSVATGPVDLHRPLSDPGLLKERH